jgi:hypothetical protein
MKWESDSSIADADIVRMESVRTYAQTVAKMNQNQGIVPLVAEYRNTVQQKITQGRCFATM